MVPWQVSHGSSDVCVNATKSEATVVPVDFFIVLSCILPSTGDLNLNAHHPTRAFVVPRSAGSLP